MIPQGNGLSLSLVEEQVRRKCFWDKHRKAVALGENGTCQRKNHQAKLLK